MCGRRQNPVAQQIEQAPVPLPAPPVSDTSPAVLQAARDYQQQQAGKKSVRKTVFAGDTGGYNPSGMMGRKY